MAGQRVVDVEGTLEGMQTAKAVGTHRVGTISCKSPVLNPSFYRSGHTLSSRVPRWSLGMPLPHWPAPPRVLLALTLRLYPTPLAYSLHYTFPTPLALTFLWGPTGWTSTPNPERVVYEVGYLYFAGGRRRECLFVCRKSAIRYSMGHCHAL